MKNRYWGANVGIVVGCLSIFSAFSPTNSTPGTGNLMVCGLVILLCAIAYKSAKKRKLGIKRNSVPRIILEFVAIFVSLFLVFWRNDLKLAIASDPLPVIVLPMWAFIAYAFVIFKRQRTEPVSV